MDITAVIATNGGHEREADPIFISGLMQFFPIKAVGMDAPSSPNVGRPRNPGHDTGQR